MDTQPPQDPRTMTWVDQQNRYWRVERAGDRWRLTLYSSPTEMWSGSATSRASPRRSTPHGGAAGGVTFAPLE